MFVVVNSLLEFLFVCELCVCLWFCGSFLCVPSSFAAILPRKEGELVALLYLFSFFYVCSGLTFFLETP